MTRSPIDRSRGRGVLALVLLVAVGSTGCSDDVADDGSEPGESVASGGASVTATVSEFLVEVDTPSAPSGEITFSVTNDGSVNHEFLVVRTDLPDGSIPVDGDRFAEDDPLLEVVDEIPDFPAGETQTLTVTLEPGAYQLVCNLSGHYASGMHTPFTVTGEPDTAEPTVPDTGTGPERSAPDSTQSALESGGVGNDADQVWVDRPPVVSHGALPWLRMSMPPAGEVRWPRTGAEG